MTLNKTLMMFFVTALAVTVMLFNHTTVIINKKNGAQQLASRGAEIMTMLMMTDLLFLEALRCSKGEKQIHFILPVVHTSTLPAIVPTHV